MNPAQLIPASFLCARATSKPEAIETWHSTPDTPGLIRHQGVQGRVLPITPEELNNAVQSTVLTYVRDKQQDVPLRVNQELAVDIIRTKLFFVVRSPFNNSLAILF